MAIVHHLGKFSFVCANDRAASGEIDIFVNGRLDRAIERIETSFTGCTSTRERIERVKESAHRWILSKGRLIP